MTRRKDAQPETAPDQAVPPEPGVTEPFMVEVESTAPVDPPAPDPVLAPPPPPPPQRSNLFGTLLGGALAAIGGFALSHFNVFGLPVPQAAVDLSAITAQIEAVKSQQATTLDKLSGEVATLGSRIAKLEAAPAPEGVDLSRLDAFDKRLAAIEAMPSDGNASTAALTAKIAELEQRIAALPTGGTDPALQQKLDDALTRLGKAEAEATARASEATAAATAALRQTAIDTLGDAIATGQPFATELQALSDPTLTSALGPLAETGVPRLATLQNSFSDPAREALRIARDTSTATGWSDRLVDFLAAQTGARPLTPQEGTTPDAILSRADFALSEGRVTDALTELGALDPAVRAPLEPWITQAKAHLAAAAAMQAARGE